MGIIFTVIGCLIAYALIRGYLRAQAGTTKRSYDKARKAAAVALQGGYVRFPTWHRDAARRNAFTEQLVLSLQDDGISEADARRAMQSEECLQAAFTIADAYEGEKFSYVGQIVGVSDFLSQLIKAGLLDQLEEERRKRPGNQPVFPPVEEETVTGDNPASREKNTGITNLQVPDDSDDDSGEFYSPPVKSSNRSPRSPVVYLAKGIGAICYTIALLCAVIFIYYVIAALFIDAGFSYANPEDIVILVLTAGLSYGLGRLVYQFVPDDAR